MKISRRTGSGLSPCSRIRSMEVCFIPTRNSPMKTLGSIWLLHNRKVGKSITVLPPQFYSRLLPKVVCSSHGRFLNCNVFDAAHVFSGYHSSTAPGFFVYLCHFGQRAKSPFFGTKSPLFRIKKIRTHLRLFI